MDLLELLGDDWAPPAPPCSAGDRLDATHGCRHCGRAPRRWSEAYGAYIDGMGRITKCGHCPSCGGSGWTLLRDPWTDMPVSNWWEVPCQRCYGGYSYHAWDFGPWAVTGDVLIDYLGAQEWAQETRRGRRTSFDRFYRWAIYRGFLGVQRSGAHRLPRAVPELVAGYVACGDEVADAE